MRNLRPLGASYRSDVCRKNRDGDLGFTHEGSAMDGRTDGGGKSAPPNYCWCVFVCSCLELGSPESRLTKDEGGIINYTIDSFFNCARFSHCVKNPLKFTTA